MPRSVQCPDGHSITVEDPASGEVVCPECGVRFSATGDDDAVPPPRGLWGVMSPPRESDEGDSSAEESAAEREAGEPSSRGLWSVMGKSADVEQPTEPADEAIASPETSVEANQTGGEETAASKGLWTLMSPRPDAGGDPDVGGEPPSSDSEPAESTESEPQESDASPDEELEVAPLEELAEDDAENEENKGESQAASASPEPFAVPAAAQPARSRGALQALILGIVAVPVSALALLPEFWLRIPAVVLGFLALMVGLLAFGEIRRSRGRQSGSRLAGGGMALGALAMLLGPLVFSNVGEYLRERFGRRRTFDNLSTVGEAVTRYRRESDHFPPGTTFRRAKNGDVELHNWMMHLLPYLGDDEAALFAKIDLQQPYNAEANRPALEENVSAYFASGASRNKTATGMAVTHFVAIGGGGVLDAGSRVAVDDVTDGLGYTIIAGEIATDFPGWGEPGRSRQFGKGLNKSHDGFGNADRTGAMFLKADGSVKFFSNKIDPDVLRKLSTYDGAESVDRSILD